MGEVSYLGIRHHGPGSARLVIAALEALQPVAVLIEGPADLTDQIVHVADPAMVPPVALLAYASAAPERAIFWPFARFSPEYQAIRWALARNIPVQFIDLPAAVTLAEVSEEQRPQDNAVARMHLAGICAQTGRKTESLTLLAEAKKLDTGGMMKEQINQMQKQMTAAPSKNQMRMAQMMGGRRKTPRR